MEIVGEVRWHFFGDMGLGTWVLFTPLDSEVLKISPETFIVNFAVIFPAMQSKCEQLYISGMTDNSLVQCGFKRAKCSSLCSHWWLLMPDFAETSIDI